MTASVACRQTSERATSSGSARARPGRAGGGSTSRARRSAASIVCTRRLLSAELDFDTDGIRIPSYGSPDESGRTQGANARRPSRRRSARVPRTWLPPRVTGRDRPRSRLHERRGVLELRRQGRALPRRARRALHEPARGLRRDDARRRRPGGGQRELSRYMADADVREPRWLPLSLGVHRACGTPRRRPPRVHRHAAEDPRGDRGHHRRARRSATGQVRRGATRDRAGVVRPHSWLQCGAPARSGRRATRALRRAPHRFSAV